MVVGRLKEHTFNYGETVDSIIDIAYAYNIDDHTAYNCWLWPYYPVQSVLDIWGGYPTVCEYCQVNTFCIFCRQIVFNQSVWAVLE